MEGIVVFDGRIRGGEESGRSYPSPLEVVYTSRGQNADAYILEQIETSKSPRQITVVTNDRGLIANAKSHGSKTVGTAPFIEWLLNRKKQISSPKPEISDSKQNIERLLIIFENRLKEEDQ